MIRDMIPSDVDEITSVCNYYIRTSTATFEIDEHSPEEMGQRLKEIKDAGLPVLVSVDEQSGRLSGYAYVHPWKARAAYSPTLEATVYLAPGHTGKGLGRELTTALLKRTRSLGKYKSAIACITANNAPSIALVKSMGFEQVSHFKSVGSKFGKTLDVVDFQIML